MNSGTFFQVQAVQKDELYQLIFQRKSGNAKVCRSSAMIYSITQWNSSIIFHW